MNNKKLIALTTAFVKDTLAGAEGGHDWFHIERVHRNAILIAKGENVDMLIVELGALLHDIADAKFHNGDESIGPRIAADFLRSLQVDEKIVAHVENIIQHVSYSSSLNSDVKGHAASEELKVIQDADRLDAIGAIGIARAFNFGGFKNRPLYDPGVNSNPDMDKESYKKRQSPTINHFYEKLLLLKDQMNTRTAIEIAEQRHEFMETYLHQFYEEWNGNK